MNNQKIIFTLFILCFICSNCSYIPEKSPMEENTVSKANNLINSTSPYLKQHAYNPVHWYPWGDEALSLAKEQNKPILLSIGYSSCHWCHVMAHESFENDSIAQFMNEHFINIKLDREERPDIDQIYMDAVQNMGLRGGWPLNVFLTPDQKPFYGGTYFPPENWLKLLGSINDAYNNNFDKLAESADQFAKSVTDDYKKKYGLGDNIQNLKIEDFEESLLGLVSNFDKEWGGMNKSPKFPMPSVWNYFFHLNFYKQNDQLRKHLLFTLDKIAAGGIYDQIGGGFSRYSVDSEWHVPHFEKMLYDNGQLLSLYSIAYKESKSPLYKQVILETTSWLKREMTHENGGFYAALDADSEGEEGKFYVWSYDEFVEVAGEDSSMLAAYFDVSLNGNWEGTNVLRTLDDMIDLAQRFEVSEEELHTKILNFKQKALLVREKRIRPGLDNKILAGWNGLMLTGLIHAYQATGENQLISIINQNSKFIYDSLISDDLLVRTFGSDNEGYLEDYATVIQAFVALYETFGEEKYLHKAQNLTDRVIANFYDEKEQLFFYSSNESEQLIARKKELFDNVIPSSNAIMVDNLWKLGTILYVQNYKTLASKMIDQVSHLISKEPEYMSYWSLVALNMMNPTAEIMIVGSDYRNIQDSINHQFIPSKICMATESSSNLELFKYKRTIEDKTTIYLCYDKTCKRPVFTAQEAMNLMEE